VNLRPVFIMTQAGTLRFIFVTLMSLNFFACGFTRAILFLSFLS